MLCGYMAHRTSIYIHEPLHLTLACLPKNWILVFIFDLFLQAMGSDFISLIGPPWHEDKWYFIMFQIKKQNFVISIPWMEEPGRLQSTGLLGVGHDWATSFSLFTFMHWRKKWQPTPVFLPGESQGRGSLVGCPLWSRTESDTTEAT